MINKKSALLAGMLLALSLSVSAQAEDFTPGVTVTEDDQSATGYTATFVYEDSDAESVKLSGSFGFYNDGETKGVEPENPIAPYDWKDGMFALGQETYSEEMTRVDGTDYWTLSMPLPSGHYQYCFYVDGSEDRIDDPVNPAPKSQVENGGAYTRSVFDVPYDSEKQPNSQDYAFAAKRQDEQTGEVSYVAYDDFEGTSRSLGIYLPYGYDEQREEPYKVLYLSHGANGDETFWFGGGAAAEIFDNLIAEGKLEPTIIVTMNNEAYEWDFDNIINNLTNSIIPFIEKTYHVGTTPADRAMAGLSMGGKTTCNVYYTNADLFSYFGIFSGADTNIDFSTLDLEAMKQPKIMVGAGCYDFGLISDKTGTAEDTFTITSLKTLLDENEITYGWHEVDGGHEWFSWMQLLRIFGEEYLWK